MLGPLVNDHSSKMDGVVANGVGQQQLPNGDAAVHREDDSGFIPFATPATQLKDRQEHADFLVLAWVLLLYRNSEESAFTAGFNGAVDGQPTKIPAASGFAAELIPSLSTPVSAVLDAVRQRRQQSVELKSENASWDGQSMFFSNAASLAEKNSDLNFHMDTRVSDGQLWVRQSWHPPLSRHMAMFHVYAYVDILNSVLADPSQTVEQAIELRERELAQLWQWNTPLPPQIDRCMHDLFREQAAQNPDKIAVTSWDGELTYQELDELSSRLAARLAALGAGFGAKIPLCFEKSMWTSVGLLAVMKSGSTFSLTDPSQPEARLRTIAEEVDARIILTSENKAELGSRIAPEGATVVAVGPQVFQTPEPAAWEPLDVPAASTSLYVIFTSGSTGKPKGIEISHANYTSGAVPRGDIVGYRPHSRVLDFTSYAFDVSIDCMLCTLATGGTICVPSEEQRMNDLGGAIVAMDANMAHMTPSVARVLDPAIMETLEVLGLGGEAVSAGDAASWSQKTRPVICYGPSECTVGCTSNGDVAPGRTSIGKGVGCATWICDPNDHNRLTPVGAVGELIVEGPVVGVGYINEPEKTAEVFIEDPKWLVAGIESSGTPGRPGRLYKTGDLVKYDPDGSGNIVFVGRKDAQVKLRGQRVELGEVEHHLRTHLPAGVKVAAEVITPGGKGVGEPTLVAFVAESKERNAANAGELATATFSLELRKVLGQMDQLLADELPIYMVPSAYIPLQHIPTLVSLKTDRKRLRELGASLSRQQLAKLRAAAAVEKRAPSTPMEVKLHELWTQFFGTDAEIGVQDNFFSLGGDSLTAMRLVAAARNEGLSLTVADIFTHPRLSEMALVVGSVSEAQVQVTPFSLLEAGWDADAARRDVADLCDNIGPAQVEDVYPCTPLQEGLMALSAKVKDAYVAQRVVELPDLEVAYKLRDAFNAAAADCAILRTRIVQVPGHGLVQVVVKGNMPWKTNSSLEQYINDDREDDMELGKALARLGVVTDGNTGKVSFVLTIHHALYDGWSMPLVVERVNRAYQGLKTERPSPFSVFIKYLCDMDREVSKKYWSEKLDGAGGPQFPALPHIGYQTQADSLLEKYVRLPKTSATNFTVATAIRGAWALVAAQYTTDDVVFGETLTGRNAPIFGVEEIEGPMITTVPLRVSINRSTRASDYLQAIHNDTVSRIPHEHLGLQHIRRLHPDAREACELRTGIVMHPSADPEDSAMVRDDEPANGFVPADDLEAAREALKFNSYALMLVCSLDSNGFLVMASFDSHCVDSARMEKVLAQLEHTVQALCEHPDAPIGDIEPLTQPERAELWTLSNIGALTLAHTARDTFGAAYPGATATWIAHPADPDHLMPAGAVGELLIESSEFLSVPSIAAPRWLAAGCGNVPGRQSRLYKTGEMAKYSADGSIVLMGRKDEQARATNKVEQAPRRDSATHQPVTTEKQRKLLRLWTRVLGLGEDEIGLDDSFFELGGDSIAAMKLVSEARLEGVKITVADMFANRRFFDMANALQVPDSPLSAVAPARKAYKPFSLLDAPLPAVTASLQNPEWSVVDVLPARPLQQIAVQGTVKLPRYSARYELMYLDQAVDKPRMFAACQELVQRNEILRTVFVECEARCFGVVLESLQVPIVEYHTDADLKGFAEKLCNFDIETLMPLGSSFVKFFYINGANDENCLIMRISHAQYDEMCLPALLHQLSALYEAKPITDAFIPFSAFVHHVIRENIPASIQYWRDLLKGSSMSVLPPPSTPLVSKKSVFINKPVDISQRSKEITVATLPTAAWALCLARRLHARDVVFGEVVTGRNLPDFPNGDKVVGPTWQYAPMRVVFQPGWTARELLSHIQQQHVASAAHEGMGLKEIVKQCTDWPQSIDWFDSVVHQDVEHVEEMTFLGAKSRLDTIYPHLEPLREWKIQAFPRGDHIIMEVVTFESWEAEAWTLLGEIENCLRQLVERPGEPLFA